MTSSARTGEAGLARGWGWAAALRDGSTVPWSAWSTPAEPRGRHLPGAQQLELLRRLNVLAGGRPAREGLVERVLEASAPGRGRSDLELVGTVPDDAPHFGPDPVDPAHLDAVELLRVASGLVAEDLVAVGPPPEPHPGRRLRPGAPAVVGGDAWVAPWAREALVRKGRPAGRLLGRTKPTAFVVGADLGTLVAHAWTARAFDEGGGSWREWLRGYARTGRTPPRADLAAHAAFWAERLGRRRVHVVTEPARLPRLLGQRRLDVPPRISPHAAELARWVGSPLGLLVLPPRRHALLRGVLAPRLDAGPDVAVPAPHLPERLHPWLAERAEVARRKVRRAGYPVHGDLDALLRPPAPGVEPDTGVALELALGLLLRPAGGGR